MAWQIFGTLAAGNQNASLFDTLSGQIAINTIVKCGASGTNAITLTTDATNGPPVPAYVTQQHFSFIAVNTSSAAVTVTVGALGALKLFAFDGVTQLGSGSIVAGREYVISYNVALDSAAGGFQLISATNPGMTLIETKMASASASLIFSTGITSAFNQYIFLLTGMLPATDSVNFNGQVSTNGGSTWHTIAGDYQRALLLSDTVGNQTFTSSISDNALLFASTMSNTVVGGFNGQVVMFNPSSSTTTRKDFNVNAAYQTPTAPTFATGLTIYVADTAAINAVKFFFSSGNIASGTISLYGIP